MISRLLSTNKIYDHILRHQALQTGDDNDTYGFKERVYSVEALFAAYCALFMFATLPIIYFSKSTSSKFAVPYDMPCQYQSLVNLMAASIYALKVRGYEGHPFDAATVTIRPCYLP
jgi:hypothetical protein